MSSYWAVAMLVAQHKAAGAVRSLEREGFEVYDPKIKVKKIIAGNRRRVDALAPLFPCYAFIRIVHGWSAARWTPGVKKIIMTGDERPARVPDRIIEQIRQRERNGVVVLHERRLQYGDRVVVMRGLFAGRSAIYADTPAPERIAILLMMLGAERRVVVGADDIEAVR